MLASTLHSTSPQPSQPSPYLTQPSAAAGPSTTTVRSPWSQHQHLQHHHERLLMANANANASSNSITQHQYCHHPPVQHGARPIGQDKPTTLAMDMNSPHSSYDDSTTSPCNSAPSSMTSAATSAAPSPLMQSPECIPFNPHVHIHSASAHHHHHHHHVISPYPSPPMTAGALPAPLPPPLRHSDGYGYGSEEGCTHDLKGCCGDSGPSSRPVRISSSPATPICPTPCSSTGPSFAMDQQIQPQPDSGRLERDRRPLQAARGSTLPFPSQMHHQPNTSALPIPTPPSLSSPSSTCHPNNTWSSLNSTPPVNHGQSPRGTPHATRFPASLKRCSTMPQKKPARSTLEKRSAVQLSLELKVEKGRGFIYIPLARNLPPAPPSSPVLGGGRPLDPDNGHTQTHGQSAANNHSHGPTRGHDHGQLTWPRAGDHGHGVQEGQRGDLDDSDFGPAWQVQGQAQGQGRQMQMQSAPLAGIQTGGLVDYFTGWQNKKIDEQEWVEHQHPQAEHSLPSNDMDVDM